MPSRPSSASELSRTRKNRQAYRGEQIQSSREISRDDAMIRSAAISAARDPSHLFSRTAEPAHAFDTDVRYDTRAHDGKITDPAGFVLVMLDNAPLLRDRVSFLPGPYRETTAGHTIPPGNAGGAQVQHLAETSSFILAMCVFSATGQAPGIMPGFGISRAVTSVVSLFSSSKVFSFHLILPAQNMESGRGFLQVREVNLPQPVPVNLHVIMHQPIYACLNPEENPGTNTKLWLKSGSGCRNCKEKVRHEIIRRIEPNK